MEIDCEAKFDFGETPCNLFKYTATGLFTGAVARPDLLHF